MGIRDWPITFRSPWQNAYVERLIGSIRRECLDHMIVFGEAHLRLILGAYAADYNEFRTYHFLNKDAPFHRAIERLGAITSHPVLGGLHHQIAESNHSVHTGATSGYVGHRIVNHENGAREIFASAIGETTRETV